LSKPLLILNIAPTSSTKKINIAKQYCFNLTLKYYGVMPRYVSYSLKVIKKIYNQLDH